MSTELFDILDCAGRKTGGTMSRDEAHESGAWHGAFHCLFIYEQEGSGRALFQKRSRLKKIAPGRYDVTVGGHYAAGENAEAAGPREIREEIGISVEFGDLVPLGRRVFLYCFTPGVTECEFQDIFFHVGSAKPEHMMLQRDEVETMVEMDIDAGIELFSGKRVSALGTLVVGAGTSGTVRISADDFVPCLDNYYLKLLLLARRYFNGEHHLLFI